MQKYTPPEADLCDLSVLCGGTGVISSIHCSLFNMVCEEAGDIYQLTIVDARVRATLGKVQYFLD
jgi:hypothetical protein